MPALPLAAQPNIVDQAFALHMAREEEARERAVVRTRRYYDGDHDVLLTDRLKEFLGLTAASSGSNDSARFRLNICKLVVRAMAERLIVTGFDTDEAPVVVKDAAGVATTTKPASAWAWKLWTRSRMDAKADEVHEGALRDGEYFVIIDWDSERRRPRFTPHQRYTGGTVEGDGEGCTMVYTNDDPSQPPLYATKRWTETVTKTTLWGQTTQERRQRLTVYYPDRIERYELRDGAWKALGDPDVPAVVPWKDAQGRPLGIPVVHFKNPGLKSELWDAIPLQDAINKALIDLIGSADMTAFQLFVALGWQPLDKDNKPISLAPGMIIGTTTSRDKASFEAIDAADLTPLIDLLSSLIGWLASVTDTPASRFQMTRQVAAEGTLKQQEGPLLSKLRNRQSLFGDAWELCLTLALRLHNALLPADAIPDADLLLSVQWAPTETRDEQAQLEQVETKGRLGIPRAQLWAEAGYSQQQIDQMKQSPEYQAYLAGLSIAQAAPAVQGVSRDGRRDTDPRDPRDGGDDAARDGQRDADEAANRRGAERGA